MPKSVTVRVSIPMLDPLVDTSSFSLEFTSSTASDFSNISAVFNAISTFMTTVPTGGVAAPGAYMSGCADHGSGHCTMTAYDITTALGIGEDHGGPVATQNFTLPTLAGGWANFPEGCAAVVSYRGDYGTDVEFGGTPPGKTRPRASDRNRFYFGPLNSAATSGDVSTNRCILKPQFINDMLQAFNILDQAHTAGADTWHLRVWSRKLAALKVPTEAWMDNRIDYQRRRADQGGTRTYQVLLGT